MSVSKTKKITIDITRTQEKYLKDFFEENKNNNSKKPYKIYIVKTRDYVLVDNKNDYDDILYSYDNSIYKSKEELKNIKESKIETIYIKYLYKNAAFFFTEKSAKEYINYQGHNLKYPIIEKEDIGYNNEGDFMPLWNVLKSMGEKINEVERNDNN